MSVSSEDELHHKELIDANIQLFLSEDNADCVLRSGNFEWKVHSNVVCRRSEYMRSVFRGNFQEKDKGVLEWPEEDPHSVECVLIYLYSLTYPSWNRFKLQGLVKTEEPTELGNGAKDAGLQGEGRHIVAPAKATEAVNEDGETMAKQPAFKFKIIPPNTTWETALGIFEIADKYGIAELRNVAVKKLQRAINDDADQDSYPSLIQKIWSLEQSGDGPAQLRSDVAKAVARAMKTLNKTKSFHKVIFKKPKLAIAVFDITNARIYELATGPGRYARNPW